MRPPCFDRPPRVAGTWEATGRTKQVPTGRAALGFKLFSDPKPVLRWRPSPFEDRCATHDGRGIGPHGESYPEAHGWDCAGCRWEPAHLRQRREFEARMTGGLVPYETTIVIDHGRPSPTLTRWRRQAELDRKVLSIQAPDWPSACSEAFSHHLAHGMGITAPLRTGLSTARPLHQDDGA